MKLSFRIFLLILIATLFSCKKNVWKGNTTAEVYVMEEGGDGINGAKVYLYGGYSGGSLLGGSSLVLLETYTTDETGYVSIDFKVKKDYKEGDFDFFTTKGYAAQYYKNDKEYDLVECEDNEVTIQLQAEAYLMVHVKNVSKNYNRFIVDDFGVPGGQGGEYKGLDVEFTVSSKTLGNRNAGLWFVMYNEGDTYETWIEIKDTIFCPAYETTEYYFEY